MASNSKKQHHGQEMKESFSQTVTLIGLFGGLIWGSVYFIAYYLNLTKVGPALMLNPWAFGGWKNKWLGQILGLVAISVLSIGVAFAYRFLFAKVKSIVFSLLYGLSLWVLIFYVLRPIFPDLLPLSKLGMNTIVTTLCIFLLYGLFIGYSIAFHYQERGR